MRSKALISALLWLISTPLLANWKMINNVDYTWGPFKIYNISLFTETGEYNAGIRPIMLTLHYEKPVDGRDFAITLSKAWSKLSISLPNQDEIIDRLKKSLPNFKPEDSLSYIALEDKGYFVLNDQVLAEEFSADVSNAILAIWLDPHSDFSRFQQKLLTPSQPPSINTEKTEITEPDLEMQTPENTESLLNPTQPNIEQTDTPTTPNSSQTPQKPLTPRQNPTMDTGNTEISESYPEVQAPKNTENLVNPTQHKTPDAEQIDNPIIPDLNTEPLSPEDESKEKDKPIIDAPIQTIPTAQRKS